MKKRSKKIQISKLLFISIIFIFIAFMSVFVINKTIKFLPIYRIDNRVENLKKYKSDDKSIKAIGWLRVQGTNIDYPVIDNNYDIDMTKIIDDFTWAQGKLDNLPNKLFILGHNIRNVSSTPLISDKNHTRFEQLLSYIYYDFVKENKYIQYTTGDKNYLYKIFSVAMVDDSTLDYVSQNYTKKQLEEYIKQSKKDSYFDFDVDVDENDKIVSLITCTRFFGPQANYTFKIDARLMRENEIANDYDVIKNKNYNQIEKILRGDQDEQKV